MSVPRMTTDRAAMVLRRLESFAKLQQRQTDEIGWIALAFSVTRAQAEKMIADARKLLGAEPERREP